MAVDSIFIDKMSILVKQAFDFQNLLQFGKRSSVAVMQFLITSVPLGLQIGIIHEPLVLTDIRCSIHRTFPAGLAEMEREAGGQCYHVVAEAVRTSITVEVLKGGRAGEFQYGTYPLRDSVLSLHPIRNGKGIMPVSGVVQQADTCKGGKIPAYLFLSGIAAAKDIP